MTLEEQNLSSNGQEKIITNEVVQSAPKQIVNEEEKQARIEESNQREKENIEKIKDLKQEILQQIENSESKEEYPEGHIMNANMLDKIAQLGAIDTDSLKFVQSRYDKYMQEEQNGKHGINSVTFNQKNLKQLLEEDPDSKEDIFAFDSNVIYGEGGWLRFEIDASGAVKLDSGISATNTTGSKQYFEALRSKAKELGMEI